MKKVFTVQELINELEKVEDKSLPVACWINSQDPEVTYPGGSRIPIIHVDTTVQGVVDMCCELMVLNNK